MTIDPNYTVGFSLARQWGIRVVKDFDHHVWLAQRWKILRPPSP
jgi:hypothetical protein